MALFWRVFLANAALLVAGVLVLALTPISVSAEIRLAQGLVLAVGVVIMLVANLLLLRPLFAPLERLARRMEDLDVLRAVRPVPATSAGEIGALERSFNRMIERLEAERRQAGTRALRAREEERDDSLNSRAGCARDGADRHFCLCGKSPANGAFEVGGMVTAFQF